MPLGKALEDELTERTLAERETLERIERDGELLTDTMDVWTLLCGEASRAKGFHEPQMREHGEVRDSSAPERMMLIVSEVAEMLEAWRDRKRDYTEVDGKPEGVAAELADVVIRCLDYAYIYRIPLGRVMLQKLAYNMTRPHRHGGRTI